jgi:hypothetical protein
MYNKQELLISLFIYLFFSQILNKLKVLNLSNSKCLTKSPDFSQVSKLEIILLEACTGLVEIHESIEGLKNLVLLKLKGCKSLMNLSSSISKLKSLKTFHLSNRLKVDNLPNQVGNMMTLTKLLSNGNANKQLPFSFGLLKNLKIASLFGCKEQSSKYLLSLLSSFMPPKSFSSLLSSLISSKSLNPVCFLLSSVLGLHSLTTLYLFGCNLSENGFLLISWVYLHSSFWIYQETIFLIYLIALGAFVNCTI